MRYLFMAAALCFAMSAVADQHSESAAAPSVVTDEPTKNDLKKDAPRPTPKRWPPKLQKMYRHAHPHPAVVGVMRSYEPVVRGKRVYVNSPGMTIHEEKGRLVHSHAVPISEKEAKEFGYVEAGKPIPRSEPSPESFGTSEAACCADHSEGECSCCDSCASAGTQKKE